MISAGNAGVTFPIQSISKVFALELALEALGEKLWERVGREPTGDPFNSIIDLRTRKGIPRNPLINAGALGDLRCARRSRKGRWADGDGSCISSRAYSMARRSKLQPEIMKRTAQAAISTAR